MDTTKVQAYVELRRREKERDSERKAVKAEADALEQELLDEFSSAGVDSLRVDDGAGGKATVYLHQQIWAKRPEGVDPKAVCDAFEAVGLGDFVNETYNAQTVSSWLRDLDREGKPIPAEFDGLLEGTTVFSVRHRKA